MGFWRWRQRRQHSTLGEQRLETLPCLVLLRQKPGNLISRVAQLRRTILTRRRRCGDLRLEDLPKGFCVPDGPLALLAPPLLIMPRPFAPIAAAAKRDSREARICAIGHMRPNNGSLGNDATTSISLIQPPRACGHPRPAESIMIM